MSLREHKGLQKRLYTKGTPAKGVILVGCCDDSLANFKQMVEIARETFPTLKDEDVTCSKVTQSRNVKGFTVILFDVPDGKTIAEGWDVWEGFLDFYW